jgi:hypothetical protein
MKNYLQAIKILAACLLLLSFFLPMSSCSYSVPIELGVDERAPGPGNVHTETRTTIIYAREFTDPEDIGTWLNMLAFIWPLLLIFLQWKFSGRQASSLIPWAGVLLAVFSAVVIYTWADFGKPLIGAYVGGSAVLALFAMYTAELIYRFRERSVS